MDHILLDTSQLYLKCLNGEKYKINTIIILNCFLFLTFGDRNSVITFDQTWYNDAVL